MTKPREIPFTVEELHNMFDEKEPGILYWRFRPSRFVDIRKPAGTDIGNYRVIRIQGRVYLRHRLIHYMHTGQQTLYPYNVDHINGYQAGDHIGNLQVLDNAENQYKRRDNCNNTSGYRGVTWHKRDKKWQASIGHNGRVKYLGQFDTPEEASDAYDAAKNKLHAGFKTLVVQE